MSRSTFSNANERNAISYVYLFIRKQKVCLEVPKGHLEASDPYLPSLAHKSIGFTFRPDCNLTLAAANCASNDSVVEFLGFIK